MFRLTAAAEMAAYLLSLNGGSMDKVKLGKLMYLTERECIFDYALPLSDDEFVFRKLGPALKQSNGFFKNGPQNNLEYRVWIRWFKRYDKNDPILHLQDTEFGQEFRDKFNNLFQGAYRIMDALFKAYKDKTSSEMVAMTYSAEVYPEWHTRTVRGKHAVTLEELCRAHGMADKAIKDIREGVEDARDIDLIWEELNEHEN